MNMRYAMRSEDTEQINVVSWANWNVNRYPELKWLHHVPNGGSRNKQEAVKLKQMQDIVSDALLNIVETEPIERETSAFDEYDRENGYEDEEQEEQNTWKICGEIVDRVTKIAIRLMRESYGQCMKENIIELLKYLKFELETVNENT